MAITTSVTVGPLQNGSVVVTSGQLVGDRDRQITLEAQPATGYKFSRWEVQTTPVQLTFFAYVERIPVQSIAEVCDPLRNLLVPMSLYTDGAMLYVDAEGITPAPTGYWGAGTGTYYYWLGGGSLPTLTTCSGGTTGGGGGGGGGGIGVGFLG